MIIIIIINFRAHTAYIVAYSASNAAQSASAAIATQTSFKSAEKALKHAHLAYSTMNLIKKIVIDEGGSVRVSSHYYISHIS